MEAELARLREENAKLRAANEQLRRGAQRERAIQWVDEPARGELPRKLERLRSYSPGEYGAVLPDAPSETSVSFASDDQPARRRRLKSYSEGEYSAALSDQDVSSSAVSFSQDTADEPLPQRRQRLKSYSQGEYGSAMDSSAGSMASAAGSVRFAAEAEEPAVAQPRLRQRLKSYSQGEYAPESLEESASSAHSRGVRFETGEAESPGPGRKLAKMKSFDQGQYKGVLTPEEQYRQAMAAAQQRSGKHLWGVARGTMAMAIGLPIAVAKPIASFNPNVAFAEAVLIDPDQVAAAAAAAAQPPASLQLNHAKPVFHPDPSAAVVKGTPLSRSHQYQHPSDGGGGGEDDEQEPAMPMDDASSDDSATEERSFTYHALLQAEEEEHQAELRRIGSGEMPTRTAASPNGATSPTKVSDWPSDFASDVAVRSPPSRRPAPFRPWP